MPGWKLALTVVLCALCPVPRPAGAQPEPVRPLVRRAFFQTLAARASGDPDRMVDVLVRVRTPGVDAVPQSPEPLAESLVARAQAVGEARASLMAGLAPNDSVPFAPGATGQGAPEWLASAMLPGLRSAPVVLSEIWPARCVHALVPARSLAALMQRPDVDGVFENVVLHAMPPDELGVRRVMDRTGQSPLADSWGQLRMRALQARATFKVDGRGVLLGHLDTGVDGRHPALAGAIHRWRDFVNGRPEPYDDEGHGTHTAGIMVGRTPGMGMAPGAKLLVGKVLDGHGNGTLANLLEGMQWMLAVGADPRSRERCVAVNNSWGVSRQELSIEGYEDTLFWETIRAWRAAGIVPVFSAGNAKAGTVLVPGGYPVNLAVGATDQADGVAEFSSSGRIDWQGWAFYKPDVTAPGVGILSAYPGSRLAYMSGTSMACPQVTGLIALSCQLRPELPVRERERVVMDGVVDIGAPGRGQRSGEGRINAEKTLQLTRDYKAPGKPPADFAPVYLRARRFRVR